ncbi:hypothetical protein SAMN05216338_102629 [Bradyrhizobium sp. Rc2d]|nr:hypothetical protein SAMN05216338_102629 [Bradyrhizobium sp. Rc2d]
MLVSGVGNRLLAALPTADFDLLAPDLQMVTLDREEVVSRVGDHTEHVLFPHSGAVSVMVDMANGQTVASAAIGREGAVGTIRAGAVPCGRYGYRSCRGDGLADPGSAFPCRFQPESCDPARSPAALQGDADTVSIGRGLQRTASRPSPHGTLAASTSRQHQPRRPSSHPGRAFADVGCTTNDGDATDAQSARFRSDQI